MSFLRTGYHGQRKKKIIARKKPSWDDSLSDLSVYKPTQQELAVRHAAHKSKNHMSVKLEKMRKAKQKNTSLSHAEARQVAIMKEVLYDQKQLHDTLSRSDKMMAVVKDLFGDDPRRFMGFPNVTSVPNGEEQSKNGSIVAPVPDIRTRTETLSDSVMKQSALNDLSDSETDDEVETVEPIVYQPQMNLKRFQQFLAAEEERNQTLSTITGQAQLSQTEGGPIQSTRLQLSQEETGYETPRKAHNESIEMLRTPRSAINDTRKVKKTKKRVSPHKENRPQNTSALNLTDLRKVLGNLENEIEQYEKQTGRRPPAEKQRSETFSGYTVALVDSVSKLATYLRETDLRLQAEMTVREQLTQDVFQLRNIVDTLTSDIIVTQEEYSSVVTEFQRYRAESREEIDRLKKAVYGTSGSQLTRAEENVSGSTRQQRVPQQSQNTQDCLPAPSASVEEDRGYSALPDHISSHAVVLSPPIRKTRVTEEQEQQPTQPKRQTSLIDITTLAESHSRLAPPSGPPPQQVATVSVPRPTPLVQSNLPEMGLSSNGHPQTMYPSSQTGTNPVQNDLPVSEQIAELNRQHEEAQKRLQLLFQQQEKQHMQMVMQQQQKYHQQQNQHQKHQQNQQQLYQSERQPLFPQQSHQQQQIYKEHQMYQSQEQQPQQYGTLRLATNTARPILEQGVHGLDSLDVSLPGYHQHNSPPRAEHAQAPVTVSPPISPISTRSENFSVLQHLQNRQRQYGGAGREIRVNLPVMDLETSAGSLASPKTISPAH